MVYTAGFADMMDRTGHYVLSLASFDATTGRLNTVKNLTSVGTFATLLLRARWHCWHFMSDHVRVAIRWRDVP